MKEKPFQPVLSLKTVIWDLLFFLSFPPHFFKAGVKFRGRNLGLQGVGDHRRPRPGGLSELWCPPSWLALPVTAVVRNRADKVIILLHDCCELSKVRGAPQNTDAGAKDELTARSAVLGSRRELAGRRNALSINSYIHRSRMQNLSTLSAGHSGTFILKRNLRRQSFIS